MNGVEAEAQKNLDSICELFFALELFLDMWILGRELLLAVHEREKLALGSCAYVTFLRYVEFSTQRSTLI